MPDRHLGTAIAAANNEMMVRRWLDDNQYADRFRGTIRVNPDDITGALREIDKYRDHPRVVQIGVPLQSRELYGKPPRGARGRAHGVLTDLELEDARYRRLEEYSTGMKQRLKLAQALVHDPQVLFLDEPTAALDPQSRRMLWDIVLRLREQGKTIILTTHYMDEAQILCDRIAILHLGHLMALGSPAELKQASGNAGATLDVVFAYYTGNTLETGGSYRDTARTRRTARRVG